MLVAPEFVRQRQESLKFKVSQGYITRPYLKKQKQKIRVKKANWGTQFETF